MRRQALFCAAIVYLAAASDALFEEGALIGAASFGAPSGGVSRLPWRKILGQKRAAFLG